MKLRDALFMDEKTQNYYIQIDLKFQWNSYKNSSRHSEVTDKAQSE